MKRIIEVKIDRLVLRGIDPSDRKALVDGLKAELSRVLADPALHAQTLRSLRRPVMKLGRMPLSSGASGGRKFGGGLARAIGKGLKP